MPRCLPIVGLLRLDCGIPTYARHEGWGYVSGNLYARAAPEKVEITEEYWVTQEISTNPSWDQGESKGRLEIVVPYDGRDYFTRQAADDVKKGIQAGNGEGTAVVGQLLLSDYARTGDLRSVMKLHRNSGVIPIKVPVPASADGLEQLTADRHGLPDQLRLPPGRAQRSVPSSSMSSCATPTR